MAELLTPHAAAAGGRAALIDDSGELSWSALDARVNRWIAVLRGCGLTAGDRIAVVTGNRRETFEVLLAALHTGLTVVPVNWHLTPAEIAYLLTDSGSAAVVADQARAAVVAAALTTGGPCPVRLVLGDSDRDGMRAVEPLLARAAPDEPDGQLSGGLMLYTSGTTGAPKGVRNGLFRQGFPMDRVQPMLGFAGRVVGVPSAGRLLLVGPWYHSAQLFFAVMALLRGSLVVVHERFDPAALLHAVERHRITHCHLVPTQFVRLLRLDPGTRTRHDLSSLQCVWHGGGPCRPEVKRQMIDWWGPVLVEYYAATEAGIVTLIGSSSWLRRPGSVGRALPGTEILIVGPDGDPLPPGRAGLVYARRERGPSFQYHNAPEQTREAHLSPRVFTYGELGYLDDDGYLFLTGRAKDVVVTGGVNVYPAEVQAVLDTHPAVADAAVIGVPDDEFGERVVAVVEPGPDAPDDLPAALDRHCRAVLAGFKVPREYVLTRSLPRDPAGKLRKAAVLDLYHRTTRPADPIAR